MTEGQAAEKPKKRKGLIIGCLACVLLPVGFVGLVAYDMIRGPRIGAHVSSSDCPMSLPDGASDVCYLRPPAFWPNTMFEFNIDEQAFRGWAEDRECPLEEIKKDDPFEIICYPYPTKGNPRLSRTKITNGLFYAWNEEDRGVYVAYDRDKGRAYYMSHTR